VARGSQPSEERLGALYLTLVSPHQRGPVCAVQLAVEVDRDRREPRCLEAQEPLVHQATVTDFAALRRNLL
jgi:hypothetical protein